MTRIYDTRQVEFAIRVAQGAPLVQAFAASYGERKYPGQAASYLAKQPAVRLMVQVTRSEIERMVRERFQLGDQLDWLVRLREASFLGAQFGAALQAHKYLDELAGYTPDKVARIEHGRPGEFAQAENVDQLRLQAKERFEALGAPEYYEAYTMVVDALRAAHEGSKPESYEEVIEGEYQEIDDAGDPGN